MYFDQCIGLYEVLVQGRNLRNSPIVQKRLPYDVVAAIITSEGVQSTHLNVSAQFVAVVRDLYVDNEPHETMAHVKKIR